MSKMLSLRFALVVLVCMQVSAIGAHAQNPNLVAYAHVLGNGTLDVANSRNVVAFQGGSNGIYCFQLTFRPKNVVATLADDPTAPNQGVGYIKAQNAPVLPAFCPDVPNADSDVVTGDQTSINGGISAGGYAFYVTWTQ
jgi:hypothetical protein